MNSHPVPKVGDTVVLNDHGLEQCFGNAEFLQHMKTLEMQITFVDPHTMTMPALTFAVEVSNPQISLLMIDHRCFDIVRRA